MRLLIVVLLLSLSMFFFNPKMFHKTFDGPIKLANTVSKYLVKIAEQYKLNVALDK